jgi:hypothetical protein
MKHYDLNTLLEERELIREQRVRDKPNYMSATKSSFKSKNFVTPKLLSLSQIVKGRDNDYKLTERYDPDVAIENERDKELKEKLRNEADQKELIEKCIYNLFGNLAESKTTANKHSVEYIKGHIESQYFKEFQLTNVENYPANFRFEGKDEARKVRGRGSIYENRYLNSERHDIDAQQLEQDMERKREIRYRWKRVLIAAALHFKKLDVNISKVRANFYILVI